MANLNKHDIQGLVARGYGALKAAQFLLLEVEEAARARAYLQEIAITDATEATEHVAIHVAFTRPGLEQLGVRERVLKTFAREFNEGMDHEVRARSLGDQGDNDPGNWKWGHETKPHALLLIYAKDEPTLESIVARERTAMKGAFRVMAVKSTTRLAGQKEHFGWRDGISTPIIDGFGGKDAVSASWTAPFPAGEFVLGYKNEYEAYTESPTVALEDDPDGLLPVTPDKTAKDLGRNGSYLVYREMTQDVPAFWKYLADNSREAPIAERARSAIELGAKMVGRWPGGAPLISSPRADDPRHAQHNAFTYYDRDRVGISCPLGAHIRRANPRDHLPSDHDDEDSVQMVRKHQMIRRGRAFGPPLASSMEPRDFLATPPDGKERGLHFICLVGHIGRQFEFVQRAWINSPNFAALFKDADPIIGVHRPSTDPNASDEFTCPTALVRRKYKGLTQFTQLVGGAYFFLPGIQALRFIARPP